MLNLAALVLHLIAVDWDRYPNLCYADCPNWHGCDCPRSSPNYHH